MLTSHISFFGNFFCSIFRDELETAGVHNIERKIRLGFQNWFRNHVSLHSHLLGILFYKDSDLCVLHVVEHEVAGYSSRRGR